MPGLREAGLTSGELIKLLERNGWVQKRVKGSHHIFKKDGVRYAIAVPHPTKDISTGTLNTILKQM
ncbi:type II toxin-antitoxin system HicA family toxin [Pantoea nemavictus]|uniref:type II toxin-antitoxin system HicA family toxin n=1 Tax=Pantoea nemavictus TaxID=2726955 RepID=UPI003BB72223